MLLKSQLEGISTIIFDLGGVVLNLDPDQTAEAFANLTNFSSNPEKSRITINEWVESNTNNKIKNLLKPVDQEEVDFYYFLYPKAFKKA